MAARNIGSPSSPGVGFWHYDPVLWSDGHVSNGLFYLGRQGEPYIQSGVMTVPDGGYHPAERFTIDYLEWAKAQRTLAPRARLKSSRGAGGPRSRRARHPYVFDHAHAVRDPNGSPLIEPNVVFLAEGEFRSRTGEVLHLTGKGHNEYMGAAFDPSRMAGQHTSPSSG